jgi:hypothetical protein
MEEATTDGSGAMAMPASVDPMYRFTQDAFGATAGNHLPGTAAVAGRVLGPDGGAAYHTTHEIGPRGLGMPRRSMTPTTASGTHQSRRNHP